MARHSSSRVKWPICLAFVVVFTVGCTTVHRLEISRFTTSNLTDARTDQILADATAVLRVNDGPGDVDCDVLLQRDGPVTAFATGNGIINSSADFTTINGLPGNIKIVNQINWCSTIGVGIIGCAPVPGSSLVAVRITPNQEGILWVHEFGHNKGLSHRNGATTVMNPFITVNQRTINAAECTAYKTP